MPLAPRRLKSNPFPPAFLIASVICVSACRISIVGYSRVESDLRNGGFGCKNTDRENPVYFSSRA